MITATLRPTLGKIQRELARWERVRHLLPDQDREALDAIVAQMNAHCPIRVTRLGATRTGGRPCHQRAKPRLRQSEIDAQQAWALGEERAIRGLSHGD